jgi:hypothetical protein
MEANKALREWRAFAQTSFNVTENKGIISTDNNIYGKVAVGEGYARKKSAQIEA